MMLLPLAVATTVALALPACSRGPAPSERLATSNAAIVGGLGTVAITAANTIVNRYSALAANVAAGATTLTVASGASLTPIANGDLLMIIQMQGATIDTTNSPTYGTLSALNGAGKYELVTAASVTGNTITLNSGCGLLNSYTAAGHTQVIWVPQYASLTVSGAGTITAPAWNGSSGGVVAIQSTTTSLTSAGAINVAGLGFRGGVVDQMTTLPPTGAPAVVSTAATAGSEKGESIAGYETEYDANSGRYGIGAPANGGGGGGPHNSGGGGGANGNNGNAWTGAGVMSLLVTGSTAWLLDPEDVANLGPTNSSGGGRGGYDYSANAANALLIAPGNTAWAGDDRQQHGGRGGRPLANSALSQVFAGGGGGAGESNNGAGTSGAAGGGIVVLLGSTVDGAGTGTIVADGATAQTTLTTGGNAGNDAPGGSGGGGSVVLAVATATNLSVSAKGGAGGAQNIPSNEAEGPGGGGGGGFIAAPASLTATNVSGALGGTSNSTGPMGFPTNGATSGATGQVVALTATSPTGLCIASDLGITMTDPSGTDQPGGTVTYTIVVTNNGPNSATGATVTDAFSGQFTGESWTCTGSACPAASGMGSLSAVLGTLAPGAQATFTVTATIASSATGTLSNTATVAAPAGTVDPNPANNTVTDSNGLSGSADLDVTLTNSAPPVVVGSTFSYTIGVTNNGPSDASTVAVQFAIPAGSTFQSAAGMGWTCTFMAPDVNCTRATLAGGASAPITVTLTAPSTPGADPATVTASAATGDPDTTNNTVTDTINFACGVDTDCPAQNYCNVGTCSMQLPNGTPIPTGAPFGGVCTPINGARVCISGACDLNGNVCGVELGDGTCTVTNQCIAGVCIGTGSNTGHCEECATDTNCSTPTPACNTTTNACVQCTGTNSTACSGSTPACSPTDTCTACTGDNGTLSTSACPASEPYCTSTGTCTMCTSNAQCTTGVHPGPICDTTTGACTTACTTDLECVSGDWCNNLSSASGTCEQKTPNGIAVPGGTCTAPIALRACVGTVCDTDNNCGYETGHGPCMATDAECRSMLCSITGATQGTCVACLTNNDCTSPMTCDPTTGTCESPDGGIGDGGTTDGGDGGLTDGGPSDAGDGGTTDAGDAGVHDSGVVDSGGVFDSGSGEAGQVDDDGVVEGGGCSTASAGHSTELAQGSFGALFALGFFAARRRRSSRRSKAA
jgi:uncharacterized repeat protein (TIGR01451 family)